MSHPHGYRRGHIFWGWAAWNQESLPRGGCIWSGPLEVGQDSPGRDRGKEFPQRRVCTKPGMVCRYRAWAHELGTGFKSSSGSNFLSPWPPAIFCVSVNLTHTIKFTHARSYFLSLPPHTCFLANRPFSVAILLYPANLLWTDKFHPSVDVTSRPLPPYITAQVQLPSGQWALLWNGYKYTPKTMLIMFYLSGQRPIVGYFVSPVSSNAILDYPF